LEISSSRPSIDAFDCELALSNQTEIAILVGKRFLLIKVSLVAAVKAAFHFNTLLFSSVQEEKIIEAVFYFVSRQLLMGRD